jgi:hypothetical protein
LDGVFLDFELFNGSIGKDIVNYGVGSLKARTTATTAATTTTKFRRVWDLDYLAGDETTTTTTATTTTTTTPSPRKDSKIKINFYPWISAILFFQAFVSSLPIIIWKSCENQTLSSILSDTSK